MSIVALYILLTTAAYYLAVRAEVTRFLWTHYPPRLDRFLWCSACSGFWYGVVVAFAIGWTQDLPFLGLGGRFWLTPILVGLGSMIWTPIVANVHVNSLLQLGVADPQASSSGSPESQSNPPHGEEGL